MRRSWQADGSRTGWESATGLYSFRIRSRKVNSNRDTGRSTATGSAALRSLSCPPQRGHLRGPVKAAVLANSSTSMEAHAMSSVLSHPDGGGPRLQVALACRQSPGRRPGASLSVRDVHVLGFAARPSTERERASRRPRRGPGLARLVAHALMVLGLGLAVPDALAEAVTETHSYLQAPDSEKVFDYQLAESIRKALSGKFDDLTVVISACLSGGFATEIGAKLKNEVGTWSVTTSRDQSKVERFAETDSSVYERFTGLKSQTDPDKWIHGWEAIWVKQLLSDPKSTVQQLYDAAKSGDYDQSGAKTSRLQFSATGNQSKVGLDEKSQSLVWYNYNRAAGAGAYQLYQGLIGAGFADKRILFAYDNLKGGDLARGDERPAPVDDDATKKNLIIDGTAGSGKLLLEVTKGLDAADKGRKKATIYLGSDGNIAQVKQEKVENPQSGEARQGRVFTPSDSATRLELDPTFINAFFVDVAGPGLPDLHRAGLPQFRWTTAEEAYSGRVDVYIEGFLAGSVDMLGRSGGAEYGIDLSDGLLLDLYYRSSLLGDLVADIVFKFHQGSFRVATDWDFELGRADSYGIALVAPPLRSTVPEAGTLALLGLGLAASLLSQRAASRRYRSGADLDFAMVSDSVLGIEIADRSRPSSIAMTPPGRYR